MILHNKKYTNVKIKNSLNNISKKNILWLVTLLITFFLLIVFKGLSLFEPGPKINFSHASGYHEEPFVLKLSSPTPNSLIYYTMDGSDVSEKAKRYNDEAGILINKSSVISVKLEGPRIKEDKIFNRTFFLEKSDLPVVSIITEPVNLWGKDTGIYIKGRDSRKTANYNRRGVEWERPAYIEFYEPGGILGFSDYAGIRIFGGASRASPQKSLRVCAKSIYGSNIFEYQLFSNAGIDQYNCFLLRSSGNDWRSTMFRDALMQSLVHDLKIETQSYRPAVVYLNGEYYGIHNIREFYDSSYFKTKYGINKKSLVMIEPNKDALEGYPKVEIGEDGDEASYVNLLEFVKKNSLKEKENFEYVSNHIDIENFTDYNLSQIYFGNNNWGSVNVKMWRFKAESSSYGVNGVYDGRWRWILYDTDTGFGFTQDYNLNVLELATQKQQRVVIDKNTYLGDWPSRLLKKLLANENYKNYFINRNADLLNTIFVPDSVLLKINEMQQGIYSEIPRHILKWGGVKDRQNVRSFSSMEEWEQNVQVLRDYALNKPDKVREQFSEKFGLRGWGQVTIKIENPKAGSVKISTVQINDEVKELTYFKDVPIQVQAIPKTGYVFEDWQGTLKGKPQNTEIILYEDTTDIEPVFKKDYLWFVKNFFKM